ncbi:zinc ABC transporter solute-binding protein [Bacillus sp. RO3]|nr:zinc ABC transporter solute-binding protein [Bacillus sp. RO3]
MKKSFLLIVVTTLLLLSACNESSSEQGETEDTTGPITIQTTLYPLKYFAERIGGESVKVDTLLPAGSDAHTFEPTSKDMVEIAEADLFIYNGLGMEPYAEKISKSLKGEKTVMLQASKGVDVIASDHHEEEGAHGEDAHHSDENSHEEEKHADESTHEGHEDEGTDDEHADESTHEGHEDEGTHEEHEEEGHGHEEEHHHHGDQDPHVWLDPERALKLAENIRDTLIELKPEQKDAFTQNYEELKQDLQTIDEDFQAVVQNSEHPEILVSHAAYGYWEEAYGIEQLAIAGLSPTQEPSQNELKELIETAKEHNIQYVIFEQNVTTRIAEIIQKEIDAKPLKIHNLSVLTEEDIANKENYLTLMEKNIETIKQAIR